MTIVSSGWTTSTGSTLQNDRIRGEKKKLKTFSSITQLKKNPARNLSDHKNQLYSQEFLFTVNTEHCDDGIQDNLGLEGIQLRLVTVRTYIDV